jgi:hypothetical protein
MGDAQQPPVLRAVVDEPICMVVPQARRELEEFHPQIRDAVTAPDEVEGFRSFQEARRAFQAKLSVADPAAMSEGWQRNYFAGCSMEGERAIEHHTRLDLRPFARIDSE